MRGVGLTWPQRAPASEPRESEEAVTVICHGHLKLRLSQALFSRLGEAGVRGQLAYDNPDVAMV